MSLLPVVEKKNPSMDSQYPSTQFKFNEMCFIRKNHNCGKIFGASKSCFIACPTMDDIEPILSIISEKLAKGGIEVIIAVKERAYGQDIFCTKICGKIIESKFCLVILDDLVEKGKNIPNPNVYYEYGLMTALNKHIIPLQKDQLKLAFNIQSYDTIKYNDKNVADELDRAIKDAIRIVESRSIIEKKDSYSKKSVWRGFELGGLDLKDQKWYLHNVIEDTDYVGYGYHGTPSFYAYIGTVDDEQSARSYLEDLKIIMHRTEKSYQSMLQTIKSKKELLQLYEKKAQSVSNPPTTTTNAAEQNKTTLKLSLSNSESILNNMSLMYIAFIINPRVNRDDFIKSAEVAIKEFPRFKLVCNEGDEISFDSLKISFLTIGL